MNPIKTFGKDKKNEINSRSNVVKFGNIIVGQLELVSHRPAETESKLNIIKNGMMSRKTVNGFGSDGLD